MHPTKHINYKHRMIFVAFYSNYCCVTNNSIDMNNWLTLDSYGNANWESGNKKKLNKPFNEYSLSELKDMYYECYPELLENKF